MKRAFWASRAQSQTLRSDLFKRFALQIRASVLFKSAFLNTGGGESGVHSLTTAITERLFDGP